VRTHCDMWSIIRRCGGLLEDVVAPLGDVAIYSNMWLLSRGKCEETLRDVVANKEMWWLIRRCVRSHKW
jgi:hypothetical protein